MAEETWPIGKRAWSREGKDLTLIAYGAMLHRCLEVAERVHAEDGAEVEVIDLMSISPMDTETIATSARKTGARGRRARGPAELRRRRRGHGAAWWRPRSSSSRRPCGASPRSTSSTRASRASAAGCRDRIACCAPSGRRSPSRRRRRPAPRLHARWRKTSSCPTLGRSHRGGDRPRPRRRRATRSSEDQAVLLVETEKAQVELPSPFGGRVAAVHVQAGQRVKVGAVLLSFGDAGRAAGAPPRPAAAPRASCQPAPSALPDRARPRPRAPAAASGGHPVDPAAGARAGRGPRARPRNGPRRPDLGRRTFAARRARRAGACVDVRHVRAPAQPGVRRGRRPSGRAEAPRPLAAPSRLPRCRGSSSGAPSSASRSAGSGGASAEHLSLAWAVIPHVTQHDQADVTELETMRRRHQKRGGEGRRGPDLDGLPRQGGRDRAPGPPALQRERSTHAAGELVLKRYYNIGVAVDTDQGLVVPVVRGVDGQGDSRAGRRARPARRADARGKATLEDLRSGTFTVTNTGALGGTGATPIINYLGGRDLSASAAPARRPSSGTARSSRASSCRCRSRSTTGSSTAWRRRASRPSSSACSRLPSASSSRDRRGRRPWSWASCPRGRPRRAGRRSGRLRRRVPRGRSRARHGARRGARRARRRVPPRRLHPVQGAPRHRGADPRRGRGRGRGRRLRAAEHRRREAPRLDAAVHRPSGEGAGRARQGARRGRRAGPRALRERRLDPRVAG